ncbi:hypothetical protein WL30_00205 [Burkholderia ubonensis]|nr:hypothetical protein WL30_00205 [Burkholderia ubonensis]KWB28108.1 hypothetical protein WL31_30145 [Burkholderia ubonensis]KWD24409.1 hypothetical protein WL60_32175 [Burkholderia ubonensis]
MTASESNGGSRGETTIARPSRITDLQRNSGEYRAGSMQQRGRCVAADSCMEPQIVISDSPIGNSAIAPPRASIASDRKARVRRNGAHGATHAFISSNRLSADTRRCRTRPIHLVQVQKYSPNIFDKY